MRAIRFDFYNIGGVAKIYGIPETSFMQVREDATSGSCHLDLEKIENIINIYVVDDSVMFIEEQGRKAPGIEYEISIIGIIPKSHLPNQQQLLTLENTPLLALFIDNNDNVRLAGTKENPLVFTRKDTTGTLNSRNQIEFEIKGKQTRPCYFIDKQVFGCL
jgi:hypothetical protein